MLDSWPLDRPSRSQENQPNRSDTDKRGAGRSGEAQRTGPVGGREPGPSIQVSSGTPLNQSTFRAFPSFGEKSQK